MFAIGRVTGGRVLKSRHGGTSTLNMLNSLNQTAAYGDRGTGSSSPPKIVECGSAESRLHRGV